MLFSTTTLLAIASAITSTSALPTKRAYTVTDADVLQYALTLEHLENAFYKKALSTMPEKMFVEAGFTPDFYSQLKYVAHDEEGHVQFLEAGLTAAGAVPVAACEYEFGFTDPKSFVALASVIEGVGVSAYSGAAQDITTKAYLTAAAAILSTEAIHQSAQRNANKEVPMANVFATPLGLNAVYSIAAPFITSCPSTNAKLPVKAYPALTLKSGSPTAPGAAIELVPATMPSKFFVTFVSGLSIIPVEAKSVANGAMMVDVPEGVSGQSYVFLTSDNSGNVTDATVLAGPAIIEATPSSPTFNLTII